MQIHELSAAECAAVLSRSHLGHLACAHLEQPYIVPISFSFDAERTCLYTFSMVGQKIEWMRENPKVCVEIEEIAGKDHWTTVLVFGRYEELQPTPHHAEARKRAEYFFEQRREWWLPAAGRVLSREHDKVVLYSVEIDRMTGRRTVRDPPLTRV